MKCFPGRGFTWVLSYLLYLWWVNLSYCISPVSGTSLLSQINLGFLSFTWVIYLSLQNLGSLYLGYLSVGHEGVNDPEGDVGEEEEGDDLTAWLGQLLGPRGAHPPRRLTDHHS